MSTQYVKEVTRTALAVILGVCVGLFIFYKFFLPSFTENKKIHTQIHPKFGGPVTDIEAANNNLEASHDEYVFQALDRNWYRKVDGLYHDSVEVFREFRELYDNFVNTHQRDLGDFKWTVGFYYNIVGKNQDDPKVNIYFIPTLVNKTTKKAKDYHILYLQAHETDPYDKYHSGGWPANQSYIYDQGTLFP